ncbi:MAG TPA: aspartate aminotransferase family protein [Gaiellaceae bacterium]|nr:aspartate aminotransferase family protein [Gaiellaceae bacterium]
MTASSEEVRERIRALEGTGMRTFWEPEPVVWARTEGCHVWDAEGRPYLDLYAGFAVANVGYCHPRVTEAILAQAGVMTHCPSAAPSEVRAALYERIAAIAPPGLDRVLLAITGAMADEMAVQLARAATGRRNVITFSGAYPGRSVGALRYTGKRAYREQFGVAAEADFIPFPDPHRSPWAGEREPGAAALALLEHALTDPASGIEPPACVLVEPIQGNGGVVVPPEGFLRGLRELCDRTGTVLVFDEIQCGFGRTGRMWASEHEGVVPDLMTIGKGIGGGLPLAALLGRAELMTTWEPDAVTSTFLANALPAAAGCAAIDVLREEGLVERSAELGERALARLQKELTGVDDVRGRGLFIGLELADADRAAERQRSLRDNGVLVGRGGRAGNVLILAPPLVIEEDLLDTGLDAIAEALG